MSYLTGSGSIRCATPQILPFALSSDDAGVELLCACGGRLRCIMRRIQAD